MTRVNLVPPKLLSNQHLLAEHREIKRIPNFLKEHYMRIRDLKHYIPEKFGLGMGHFKFFLDKGHFTQTRYLEIYNECVRRDFKIQDYLGAWNVYWDLPIKWYKDFVPTEEEIKISADRLVERDPLRYQNLHLILEKKTY